MHKTIITLETQMDLEKFHQKSARIRALEFLAKEWNVLSFPKPHAEKQVVLSYGLVISPIAHMPRNSINKYQF